METDNSGLGQNSQQRPLLKKVKRPINRAPQAPMNSVSSNIEPDRTLNSAPSNAKLNSQKEDPFAASSTKDLNSPFVSKGNNADDAFNLDAYLDDALPTKASSATNNNAPRRFLGEEDLPPLQQQLSQDVIDDEPVMTTSDIPPYLTKKVLIMLGALLFFIGIITAKVFFSEERVVRNGLQGVVVNPEVPKGRARCGVAERTQGCILYIMNPQRQEMPARDFYDLAAQLTGRQRFVIETGNMRYSNTKIRPGDIAQFNIPPL